MIDHILAFVVGRYWGVTPEIAQAMVSVLSRRLAVDPLTPSEVAARVAAGVRPREAPSPEEGGAIAVLPVTGLLAHRARMLQNVSSPASTSAEQLSQQLRALASDPRVGSIVLDIDSPGGAIEGIPELAAEIRRTRDTKPVVAVANALAGSAAYWLAAQATEIVVTPSGQVGSIGVYAIHEDVSQRLAAEGRQITLISAGKYKTEGHPFGPLSADAAAATRAKVDAVYGMFVDDVARGRGVSVARVRDGFGQGRTVLAREAVSLGMADRVDTLAAVLSELGRGQSSAGRPTSARSSRALEMGAADRDLDFRIRRARTFGAHVRHRQTPAPGAATPALGSGTPASRAADGDLDSRIRRLRLAQRRAVGA